MGRQQSPPQLIRSPCISGSRVVWQGQSWGAGLLAALPPSRRHPFALGEELFVSQRRTVLPVGVFGFQTRLCVHRVSTFAVRGEREAGGRELPSTLSKGFAQGLPEGALAASITEHVHEGELGEKNRFLFLFL